jgi:hypothetical protein
MSRIEAEKAISVVSFISNSLRYINGIQLAKFGNCSLLLVYLFLYSYEAEFIQKLIKDKQITEVKAFNLTFMYIDDVLSITNPKFANIGELM